MSKDKRVYTFEDWLVGETLPTQFPEGEKVSLYEVNTSQLLRPEEKNDLPLALYKLNRMNKEDFEKVRQKQRKAYRILLNAYIDKAINKINSYEDNKEKKRYVEKRKVFIENWIKDVSSETTSKLDDDSLDLQYFKGERCKSIIEAHNKGKDFYLEGAKTIKADSITGKKIKEYRVSESFELQILLAELQEIEEQLEPLSDRKKEEEELLLEFVQIKSQDYKYEPEIVYKYLKQFLEYQELPKFRDKTKDALKKKGYDLPNDQALTNWEKAWNQFHFSRTGKHSILRFQ